MTSPFPERQWTLPEVALFCAEWVKGSKCVDCGEVIDDKDFVQVKLLRFCPGTKPGEPRPVKHETCEDPKGLIAWDVAIKDGFTEAMRGHKTQVNTYNWEHRR